MAGMDDLDFDGIVDDALMLGDDDDTARFEPEKLTRPMSRKGAETPVLSGRNMASHPSGNDPGDETAAVTDDSASETMDESSENSSEKPPSRINFDAIYRKAGLPTAEGFTVFRIEELLADEEMADLDEHARLVAVKAILKSHGVDIEEVFGDASARREALDSHDERLKSRISRVEEEIDDENTRLQTEIEEFASPRIAKMEANNDRLERLRREYREWFARKKREASRLAEILEPWGGDDRLRVTAELPETVPTPAVSADDVFEPSEEGDGGDPGSTQEDWRFREDDSPPKKRREPSVKTKLPSEFEPASVEEADVTGSFDFQRPRLRGPRTPAQGLVAAFGIVLWAFAGILLAIQLVAVLEAVAAIAVAFGVPLVVAFAVAVATRRTENWWTGFFAVLFYLGLASLILAHVDPPALVQAATTRPIAVVDQARLDADVESGVHRLTSLYAHAIAGPLGVEDALVEPDALVDPDADADGEEGAPGSEPGEAPP